MTESVTAGADSDIFNTCLPFSNLAFLTFTFTDDTQLLRDGPLHRILLTLLPHMPALRFLQLCLMNDFPVELRDMLHLCDLLVALVSERDSAESAAATPAALSSSSSSSSCASSICAPLPYLNVWMAFKDEYGRGAQLTSLLQRNSNAVARIDVMTQEIVNYWSHWN